MTGAVVQKVSGKPRPVVLQDAGSAWVAVKERVKADIRECAAVAGEILWTVCSAEANLMNVCSTWNMQNCVELRFDAESSRIVCRFGEALSTRALEFDAAGGQLSHANAAVTPDQVAALVLERLRFPDE